MISQKDRYKSDPVFRQLVDTIENYLEVNDCRQFTPTEMREAVMYAAARYEYNHIRPIQHSSPVKGISKRVIIKNGWYRAGERGAIVDVGTITIGGAKWSAVLMDNGGSLPEWHKTASLETIRE